MNTWIRWWRNARNRLSHRRKPKVLLLLYMIQDLDLALLISDFLKTAGIDHRFLVTMDLAKKSPRVITLLKERDARFWVAPRIESSWSSLILSGFDSFLTIVETTAAPHQTGYRMTQRARELGLKTYTFQHGLENIGLTYFDEKYNKDNIRFASDSVFIWCREDRLHPDIAPETLQKCIRSGSPKTAKLLAHPDPIRQVTGSRKIVSIFENLHWERYDEAYRESFVASVRQVAASHPEFLFILKPHHAGQWLTRKYKGPLDFGPNVIVANPTDPAWEPYTGPDLIAASEAVLTTPSTISLDAAILGKPVALIGHGLNLEFYRPLPVLNQARDWGDFLSRVSNEEGVKTTKDLNEEFIQAVTSPSNTSEIIVRKIISDFTGK